MASLGTMVPVRKGAVLGLGLLLQGVAPGLKGNVPVGQQTVPVLDLAPKLLCPAEAHGICTSSDGVWIQPHCILGQP